MDNSTSLPTTPSGPQGKRGRKRIAVFLGEEDPFGDSVSPNGGSGAMTRSPLVTSGQAREGVCTAVANGNGILNHNGKLADDPCNSTPRVLIQSSGNTFGMTTAERQTIAASDMASYYQSMGIELGHDTTTPTAQRTAGRAPRASIASVGSDHLHTSANMGNTVFSASSSDRDKLARIPSLVSANEDSTMMVFVNNAENGNDASLSGSVGVFVSGAPLSPAQGNGGSVGRSASSLSTNSGRILRSNSRNRRGSPAYLPELPVRVSATSRSPSHRPASGSLAHGCPAPKPSSVVRRLRAVLEAAENEYGEDSDY